ncbi:hypothetical protein LTR60_002498, partial [Cryomyces antarcticus]
MIGTTSDGFVVRKRSASPAPHMKRPSCPFNPHAPHLQSFQRHYYLHWPPTLSAARPCLCPKIRYFSYATPPSFRALYGFDNPPPLSTHAQFWFRSPRPGQAAKIMEGYDAITAYYLEQVRLDDLRTIRYASLAGGRLDASAASTIQEAATSMKIKSGAAAVAAVTTTAATAAAATGAGWCPSVADLVHFIQVVATVLSHGTLAIIFIVGTVALASTLLCRLKDVSSQSVIGALVWRVTIWGLQRAWRLPQQGLHSLASLSDFGAAFGAVSRETVDTWERALHSPFRYRTQAFTRAVKRSFAVWGVVAALALLLVQLRGSVDEKYLCGPSTVRGDACVSVRRETMLVGPRKEFGSNSHYDPRLRESAAAVASPREDGGMVGWAASGVGETISATSGTKKLSGQSIMSGRKTRSAEEERTEEKGMDF